MRCLIAHIGLVGRVLCRMGGMWHILRNMLIQSCHLAWIQRLRITMIALYFLRWDLWYRRCLHLCYARLTQIARQGRTRLRFSNCPLR